MSYCRVTYQDRIIIYRLLQQGKTQSEIALTIAKSASTVCRELKRNKGLRGYRPKQAQRLSESREHHKHRPYKMTYSMTQQIKELLGRKWSPEQISYRLLYEKQPTVSPETIYRYVYKNKHQEHGDLWKNLRRCHRIRGKRFPKADRRGKIHSAREISNREFIVNQRIRIGDWERDTMLGLNRKTGILVLTERKSRYNRFVKLNVKTAKIVTNKTLKALRDFPVHTLTNDRGQEFSDHERCEKKLGRPIYFCDPYTSSQRGTNENRIGILRQYFPKRTSLEHVTPALLKRVELEINHRPMKCLDWKTPYEVMIESNCTSDV